MTRPRTRPKKNNKKRRRKMMMKRAMKTKRKRQMTWQPPEKRHKMCQTRPWPPTISTEAMLILLMLPRPRPTMRPPPLPRWTACPPRRPPPRHPRRVKTPSRSFGHCYRTPSSGWKRAPMQAKRRTRRRAAAAGRSVAPASGPRDR